MTFPELAAFEEECADVDRTLAMVTAEDWGRHGLGEWTVAELVAHMVRGATRIDAYLGVAPRGKPIRDRVSYFQFDLETQAPVIAQRARQEAASINPEDLPARFASGWRASVDRAAALPPEHVIATFRGPMRLDEYAATRVVEMVVHHMDLRMALDQPPGATPAAGRLAMSVLEGLLGSPRPRNHGRTRFILAATGRISSADDRFPVLR
ncbi:MAG: maleylpyruvate isomerase N-terminal domain-containing protein [Egibacteraceae bacterium]